MKIHERIGYKKFYLFVCLCSDMQTALHHRGVALGSVQNLMETSQSEWTKTKSNVKISAAFLAGTTFNGTFAKTLQELKIARAWIWNTDRLGFDIAEIRVIEESYQVDMQTPSDTLIM